MKNNPVAVAIIVISIMMFLIVFIMPIIYFGYRYKINSQNRLTRIPYAIVDIHPNERITATIVGYKNIKQKDLPNDIYIDINDIIGKCVKNTTWIYEEDFFYKNTIEECNN